MAAYIRNGRADDRRIAADSDRLAIPVGQESVRGREARGFSHVCPTGRGLHKDVGLACSIHAGMVLTTSSHDERAAVCGNGNRSTTEVVVNLAIGRSQFRHIGRSTGPAASRLQIYIDCALSDSSADRSEWG